MFSLRIYMATLTWHTNISFYAVTVLLPAMDKKLIQFLFSRYEIEAACRHTGEETLREKLCLSKKNGG